MKTLLCLSLLAAACLWVGSANAADAAKDFTGQAGCAMCAFQSKAVQQCTPALKVGETVYLLTAAENADDATKAALKKITGAAKATNMVVKGTLKQDGKTIVVQSLKPAEEKKG